MDFSPNSGARNAAFLRSSAGNSLSVFIASIKMDTSHLRKRSVDLSPPIWFGLILEPPASWHQPSAFSLLPPISIQSIQFDSIRLVRFVRSFVLHSAVIVHKFQVSHNVYTMSPSFLLRLALRFPLCPLRQRPSSAGPLENMQMKSPKNIMR